MQIFSSSSQKRASTLALLSLFVAGFAASGMWTSSIADTTPKNDEGQPLPGAKSPAAGEGGWREDTLIVLANPRATGEDLQDALQEVKGTVVRKMKVGNQEFLVIKTEKGKLEETFKNMSKDTEHFSVVQRNYTYKKQQCLIPTDPAYPSQYELSVLSVPGGWCPNNATGQGQTIAVFDTGVNPIADLSGKLLPGFNAFAGTGNGDHDTDPDSLGHGTACAASAAAATFNSVNTASPAYSSRIYPIVISDPTGSADDASIIAGIEKCIEQNIKISTCSFNATPPYSFSAAKRHVALQLALNSYNSFGGLFFNASGNERKSIKDPRRSNLIVVAAIDSALKIASFSNTGNSVWFVAPGVLIQTSDKDGNGVSISGTSFSTPLTAGVAAMVWSKFPSLTGSQVISRMVNSCYKPAGRKKELTKYALGIPRAQLATQ